MSRIVLACFLALSLHACDSDSGPKRAIGASCTDAGQCESGLCAQSTCIDPATCESVLAQVDAETALNLPCAAGIAELALTPDPATPDSNGQVQFTLLATFGSDTFAEAPSQSVDGTGGASDVPASNFGALTMAQSDLTAAATFTADSEAVFFEREPAGLATVSGEGTFTITATIQRGEITRTATAQIVTTAAVDGGSASPTP
ncbi:MAG: hypothetical protein EP329_02125 [Deltaproteobacteria bacterium]|nr:MAG: hypothetical protein EP329_02125 [Deltaproteobacteria bacterium]